MVKSPIQATIDYLTKHIHAKRDILEVADDLLEEEREMVAQAWIAGNKAGWDMSTDYEEHGYDYYDQKYNKKDKL